MRLLAQIGIRLQVLDDAEFLTTLPGDTYTLVYELPEEVHERIRVVMNELLTGPTDTRRAAPGVRERRRRSRGLRGRRHRRGGGER
mgnify:CR=1 FL=1